MTTDNPAKARLLRELAAATGAQRAAQKQVAKATDDRNAKALECQAADATYEELAAATGLSKVGVYKMLRSGNDGPLAAG